MRNLLMVLCGKYHAKFLQIAISSQNLKTLSEVGMFQIFTEPGDRAGNSLCLLWRLFSDGIC